MQNETTAPDTTTDVASPLEPFVMRMQADDCHWDNVTDYIQIKMFGFCGCGDPEGNLEFVMKGLEHINEKRPENIDHSTWFKGWVERGHKVFGNEEARYFFFYWADKEELTEHGGAVPGWLTEKGHELLNALIALKEDGAFDDA